MLRTIVLWVVRVFGVLLLLLLGACSLNDPFGSSTPVQGVPGQPGGGPPRGQAVQGQVRDAQGQPIQGVLVVPQGSEPVPEIAVFTNAQGSYRWSLAPGTYTMTFSMDGYSPAKHSVTVPADQQVSLDVTLTKQP
jgi:hypothetical protein